MDASTSATGARRAAWVMLLALVCGFSLSQAFRTMAAILAPPLQGEFGLSPRQLGVFAGVFHLAFGGLQLFMGMGIDVWGPRRTVLAVFPLTVLGSVIAATADGYPQLLLAQFVIGVGCGPAFLVCTVFIARRFPAERFAAVSGAALGLGSAGLLLSATPLAWVIELSSWRMGFVALAVLAAGAWLAILLLVEDAPAAAGEGAPRLAVGAALRGYGELFRLPHTWGIVVLGTFTYAAALSLRGLWMGPLLVERHGLTLVQAGHVALLVSIMGMAGAPLFGRLDPGDARRRAWITGWTLVCAALFLAMGVSRHLAFDVAATTVLSLLSGYIVLQYADVRSAYPARMTGRAMAVFTMAMFLGVGLMQWLTGVVAEAAQRAGAETYEAVLAAIAVLLGAATFAFKVLPGPERPPAA